MVYNSYKDSECTWEEYHGLGIRFENEEVAAVGFSSLVN